MSSGSNTDGLIIDVPQELSRLRRAEETGLTVLAAVAWLTGLRPLLLLVLWYLGGQAAYTHMVKLEGWNNRGYFVMLGTIFAGLSALVLAWNRYNALRFRRAERRRLQPTRSEADLPASFSLSLEEIERIRQSRHLLVERPERTQVVVTCADGERMLARHDPLGPRPDRAAGLRSAA
jgi:poly-beta-1,6-N-acetyl-D-glucosamine biosynthesis protein PgaD